jgi:tetratricopeptide (TPR) repeat protein
MMFKPDCADTWYNMGNALQEFGKIEEAIEAYTKALSLMPEMAKAHNNVGNALKEFGKIEEAIEAYTKALSLEPDNAGAHRNLSFIKKYIEDDDQIVQVKNLYARKNLSEDARCNLGFTLAKIYEDIGNIDKSYEFLTKGNALRKKLLSYSIEHDKNLFTKLKNAQPYLLKNSLDIKEGSIEPTPIFIVGMPRSGTTLVEQIISSHSELIGGGELRYVSQLGFKLSTDSMCINTPVMSEFRQKYLSELTKISSGKRFVTDKMPQNFLFIPLICATFPDAKIVHVKRDPAATCWSNFKQYFVTKNLGYCYNLQDVVEYYNLYKDLMMLWQSQYGDRIYHLNYENLTTDQEKETRELIKHLNLDWEKACLSPHQNKRSVRTASEQQVRQKVYQGSSDAWRKYEPFLNGAFDSLPSL